MEKSSPTGSLVCASAPRQVSTSSTTLRRSRYRSSPDTAEVASDQRHGRALQWPHRRSAAKPPFPIRRGTGDDAASLRLALQPAASSISLGQQDAVANHDRLAQTQAGAVQETAILPAGM